MLLLGFLALAGFPFLSGFYSKDLILETAFSQYTFVGSFTYWFGALSAGLTAFYSFRVMYSTFWSNPMGFRYTFQSIHEVDLPTGLSLFLLAIGSLFSGFFLKNCFVGAGTSFWGNSIYIKTNVIVDVEYIPLFIKNIPLLFSISGIILAILWNSCFKLYYCTFFAQNLDNIQIMYPQKLVKLIWFFNNKWYFDYTYNYYIGFYILKTSYENFYKLIDKGLIEVCLVDLLNKVIYKMSKILSNRQIGSIYHNSSLLFLAVWLLFSIILLV